MNRCYQVETMAGEVVSCVGCRPLLAKILARKLAVLMRRALHVRELAEGAISFGPYFPERRRR